MANNNEGLSLGRDSEINSHAELVTPLGRTLRLYVPEDASALFEAIDEDRNHLSQYDDDTGTKPAYATPESTRDSIINPTDPFKQRYGIWDNDRLVGGINIRRIQKTSGAVIGYWIRASEVRKHYALDALETLRDAAFTKMGFSFLLADTHPGNEASQHTLRGAGFHEVAYTGKRREFIIERND